MFSLLTTLPYRVAGLLVCLGGIGSYQYLKLAESSQPETSAGAVQPGGGPNGAELATLRERGAAAAQPFSGGGRGGSSQQ